MQPKVTDGAELARHGHLIALLQRSPPIRRLSRALQVIGLLWRPSWRSCFKGTSHCQIRPTADDVAVVAAHGADARVEVRRAVLLALAHAAPHSDAAALAVQRGLADSDATVRIQAARAGAALGLGATLGKKLLERLEDPVWTVRWHAARALAATSSRAIALEALLGSQPRRTDSARDTYIEEEWRSCADAFASEPSMRDRLATLKPALG